MQLKYLRPFIFCCTAFFAIAQIGSFFLPFAIFNGWLENGRYVYEVIPMYGDNLFLVFTSISLTIVIASISFNRLLIIVLNSIVFALLLLLLLGISMSWGYSQYPFRAETGAGLTLYVLSTGGLIISSLIWAVPAGRSKQAVGQNGYPLLQLLSRL